MIGSGHGGFSPGKSAKYFKNLQPDDFIKMDTTQAESVNSIRQSVGLSDIGTSDKFAPVDAFGEFQRQAAREIAAKADKKFIGMLTSHMGDSIHDHIGRPFNEDELKLMTEKLVSGVAKASGIPAGAIGADVASSHRLELDMGQIMRTLTQEQIIQMLLNKMNISSTPSMIHAVGSYINRHGTEILGTLVSENEPEPDDFLGEMKQKLLKVHGVTDIQPLLDNYPDYASIIVKINMSKFDDEEVDQYMGEIDALIQEGKPKGLMELEVIYHNKVVY